MRPGDFDRAVAVWKALLREWGGKAAPIERGLTIGGLATPIEALRRQADFYERFEKSRQRLCPNGLEPRMVIDKNGRRMSVCVRITPAQVSSDPLHHARTSLHGATHVMRVPGPDGVRYYATHGLPAKTSLGTKLDKLRHPAQHFSDDVHGIEIDPESHQAGHSPMQAYFHAVSHSILAGADGEPYGVVVPERRDADGRPTRYRLVRRPDHQYFNRVGRRRESGAAPGGWGGGLALSPAQLAYLKEHPPRQGVESGPDGTVFASWSRLELPALDRDGLPLGGRAPLVRYDVRLEPIVYGNRYHELGTRPSRKLEGDAPLVERQLHRYMNGLRDRLFPREADRKPAGTLEELVHRHQGNLDALIASGDLGHENAPGSAAHKQRLVVARKPLDDRDAERLVTAWVAQHPGAAQALHHYAKRSFALLDAATVDSAIERGVLFALHRFDPRRGVSFLDYARQAARGAIATAAQARGAAYGAERTAAGLEPTREPDTSSRDRAAAIAAYRRNAGSQAAFQQVLAEALPDDPQARRALSALYPTGDMAHGAPFREVSEQTGIAIPDLLQLRNRSLERVRSHKTYRRYYDQHLQHEDENRAQLDRSLGRGEPARRLARAIRSLVAEAERDQVLAQLRGPCAGNA